MPTEAARRAAPPATPSTARTTWPADGTMKVATFAPVNARYVRLEAGASHGDDVAATQISVGAAPFEP